MSGDSQSGGYFMRDRNRVSGPFDVETLRRFARGQRLARHHQLSVDRMTWVRAADLLPEVFVAHVNVPQRAAVEPVMAPTEEEEYTQLDQSGFVADAAIPSIALRAQVPWGLIAALTAVVGGGGAVAVLVWLTVGLADSRWSARDVQNAVSPTLTVVRGMTTKGGKATCYGVVVSRHHVVVPMIAATYRAPKVESEDREGNREWHSASLVLVDPVSNLAVLRADLGQAANAIKIPEERTLPRVQDDLYVVAPDRPGLEVVCRAELDEVAERGEPEQKLLVSFDDELPDSKELFGRVVTDEQGTLAGFVVGAWPDGRAVCVAANELRIKRNEAKKLPADHSLAPIDDDAPKKRNADNDDETEAEDTPEDRTAPGTPRKDSAEDEPATESDSEEAESDESHMPRDTRGADESGERGRRPKDEAAGRESSSGASKTKAAPVTRRQTAKKSGSVHAEETPPRASGQDFIGALGEAGASVVSGLTDVATPRLSDHTAETLGRNHLEGILESHASCRDKAIVTRVGRLCDEMLRAAGEDRSRYTVNVIEDSAVNAYAFIGRNLVVTTGFMDFAGRDDDMIRFVLAHEIGHLVLGHADQPYRRLVTVDGLVPGGAVAAGFAQATFKNSPMNQSQEKAADCFAVSCLRRAGRSIDGGVRFFEKIAAKEGGSDGDVLGALFSSHPDSRLRVEHLRNGCGREDE